MDEYYKSPGWQRRRLEAMQYADFRCQLCNAKDKQLHVHHRTYDSFKDEPPNDLIVLCEDCHAKFHGKRAPESVETEPTDEELKSRIFTVLEHLQPEKLGG